MAIAEGNNEAKQHPHLKKTIHGLTGRLSLALFKVRLLIWMIFRFICLQNTSQRPAVSTTPLFSFEEPSLATPVSTSFKAPSQAHQE